MTTDYRALCAELLDEWDAASGDPDLISFAIAITRVRTALAQPELQGPTDEDLYDLAEVFNGDPVPAMRRALELWGRPAIEPVPVSERLPGPGDCDAEGRCWWWIVDQPGELPHWIYCTLEVLSWTNFTAWLPHYALPTHDPLPRLLALAELERR